MIELVIMVFIVSFMGSMIVRMTVQRRNDKVINSLAVENMRLRAGIGQQQGYNADNTVNAKDLYADDISGGVYNADGKRVN